MKSMRNPLKYLVVMEPHRPQQTALSRAVQLAKKTNAHIEAFSCTYLEDEQLNLHHSRQDAKHTALHALEHWSTFLPPSDCYAGGKIESQQNELLT